VRRSRPIGRALSALAAMAFVVGCPSEEPEPEPEPTPAPPAGRMASDVALAGVTVNQGVAVVVQDGVDEVGVLDRNAPLVAGRPGILRAFVTPDEGFDARDLVGELVLVDGDTTQVRRQTRFIEGPSASEDLDSTFVFDLAAEDVTSTTRWSLAVREVEGAPTTMDPGRWAAWPAVEEPTSPSADLDEAYDLGTTWLGASDWGGVVRVHIIPVRYDTDGSGRLPDTSPEQLDLLRSWMLRLYPVREVVLEVGEVYPTTLPFDSSSGPMSDLLSELQELRTARGIPFDTYIYAMVNPAESRALYCSSGCTAGIAYRVFNPNTSRLRAGVGLGYSGVGTAETMAHEVGHNHDRGHADCGNPDNVDGNYPYPNARIGVWGWDIVDGGLVDPVVHSDFMAYCDERWTSDYQYDRIWRRTATIEGLAQWQGEGADYQLVSLRPGGRSTVRGVAHLAGPPTNDVTSVELLDTSGSSLGKVDGHLVPIEDAGPGMAELFVPVLSDDVAALRLADGRVVER